MTEEEKQAIEDLRKILFQTMQANECGLSTNDFKDEIKTYTDILNLIEKLQKENEELRQNYDTATTEIEELKEQKEIDMYLIGDSISKEIVKRDYIPKDKIRHLLKTYNISTDLSKTRDLESCDIFVDDIIELLEEE